MINKKIILWTVGAFMAGGVYAARQSIINNGKGQPEPKISKKAAEPKSPAKPPAEPPKPKEHDVTLILIAEIPKSGNAKDIGCGNTTKPMTQKSTSKAGSVQDALEVLFALKKAGYAKGELYNALYQSKLKVQSVDTKDDIVTVRLTGNIKLGGECDIPRVRAQLMDTIKIASDAKDIVVLVNGKKLKDALSLK